MAAGTFSPDIAGLVGPENQGFKQIMAQMDYERAGIERLMQNYPLYERLVDHLKKIGADKRKSGFYAWARDRAAKLATEFHIGRLLCYNTAWMVDQGIIPSSQAAMAKAWCSEAYKKSTWIAHQLHGGMGFSEEYDLHLYYKQAKTEELHFGDPFFHRAKVADQLGF